MKRRRKRNESVRMRTNSLRVGGEMIEDAELSMMGVLAMGMMLRLPGEIG